MTPQSLLPRKTAGGNYSTKKITANRVSDADELDEDVDLGRHDILETDKEKSTKKISTASGSSKKYTLPFSKIFDSHIL